MKKKIIATLGRLPVKTLPELQNHAQTDCGKYIQHSISYLVEANERVNAFLLVPKNIAGKCSAIVAAHQHAGQYHIGKSEPAGLAGDAMYFYGKELAELGFVVICPDHLGFEERNPFDEEQAKQHSNGSYNERELFCKAISVGETLQGKYVHDLSVAVDVLCGLDYVDTERIGVIGHSLGGQEALWLTFYDDRIKAGVSSCGFSTLEAVFANHIPHNFAMFTFGLINAGDNVALIEQIAKDKKAFMMTNGTKDEIFPMEGVYKIHKAAGDIYAEQGMSEKFMPVVFDGEHAFPKEFRERAYEFLRETLNI